jgi:hypothetical protein
VIFVGYCLEFYQYNHRDQERDHEINQYDWDNAQDGKYEKITTKFTPQLFSCICYTPETNLPQIVRRMIVHTMKTFRQISGRKKYNQKNYFAGKFKYQPKEKWQYQYTMTANDVMKSFIKVPETFIKINVNILEKNDFLCECQAQGYLDGTVLFHIFFAVMEEFEKKIKGIE